MKPNNPLPAQAKEKSNMKASLIVGLMFAMFVVPYVYVLYIYKSGDIPTTGTTERGTFFQPQYDLNHEDIKDPQGITWQTSALKKQWSIMNFADLDCQQSCLESIFNTQQSISSLTRNKGKVDQIILIHPELTIGEDLQTIIDLKDNVHPIVNLGLFDKVAKQMKVEGSLSNHSAIIDPNNKLLLFYQPNQSVQDVLRDIKRLLKASIGGYTDDTAE